MSKHNRVTLTEQLFRDQARAPGASGDLSTVFSRLSLAGRMISAEIMTAGFVGKLGYTGSVNVQDEDVRELDVIANDIFNQLFQNVDAVAALASEEMEDVHVYDRSGQSKYLISHDPLDGSGNVDIDGPMGTIFGIHRCGSADIGPDAFLRPGTEQVAAGYILYGPATMFVYALADGPVQGFTLDRAIGTFFLTHPEMKFPSGRGSYAVNESNESKWPPATVEMVRRFRNGENESGRRSARYIGALVADFHRTLIQGGIYMYPGESQRPQGKLRLLYEAAPLAMVARQAGGHATDGARPILDLTPTELHHRCPLFIGAREDVEEATRLVQGG